MKRKQSYYECHITIEAPLEARDSVREAVQTRKWSYSEHDEDHEIGPGLRCYANRSFKASLPVQEVIQKLEYEQQSLAMSLASRKAGRVVRYKVEMVLHDVVTDALTTSGSHLVSRRNARLSAQKGK